MNTEDKRLHAAIARFGPLCLLLLMFLRMISSAAHTSPTYDEYIYIARGYTYLKTGDTRLKLRHPMLVDTLATLPLLLMPDITLPLDDVGWVEGDFHRYAPAFMWRANDAIADKIMFLARLPIMGLTLILGAGVFRWAKRLSGRWAGIIGLCLYTFDPNILAHGRLVTPDLGQTMFIFFSAWAWFSYLERPNWQRLGTTGILWGLALSAGFPALILAPIFLVTLLVAEWKKTRNWHSLTLGLSKLALIPIVAWCVIWALYSFDWGIAQPIGLSLPAPYYWEEFFDLIQRLSREDLAYFNGEVYRGGKVTFFIVALFIKTPIATLLMWLTGGIALFKRRQFWGNTMALWVLPVVYYGNALRSDLNIGYRHILPILPFLFVIAGESIHWAKKRKTQWIFAGAGLWLMVSSLGIHPFYLAYFNELIGGSRNGRQYLAVSDLDWGQDLPGLREYLAQQNITKPIYLSWFGTTPPEHYDIAYHQLPAWPPPEHPEHIVYHPEYPPSGIYAISAANLVGARLADQQTFAWFWEQPSVAQIGHSIFIYRVPQLLNQGADPINLALSGVGLAELPPTIIEEQFQTNDMRPRWFDARTALIFPESRAFMLVADNLIQQSQVFADVFGKSVPATTFTLKSGTSVTAYDNAQLNQIKTEIMKSTQKTVLYSTDLIPQKHISETVSLPIMFGERFVLLGYKVLNIQSETSSVDLLTIWQVEQQDSTPSAIFAHVFDDNGELLGQNDRLDVALTGLRPGDSFVQVHQVTFPANAQQSLWVQMGMYRQDTLKRLTCITGNGQKCPGERVILINR